MSTKKRASGEGSVYQRPDGRWVAQTNTEPDPRTGRRRRKTVYGRTQSEVLGKLRTAQRDIRAGLSLEDDTITVSHYLDRWVAGLPGQVSEGTSDLYASQVRIHLKPALGRLQLRKLTISDCDRLWADMRTRGKAPATVRSVRSVLRRALAVAERDGLVLRNVARLSNSPRIDQPEGRALNVHQARKLLEAVRGDRHELAFVLLISCGLRRGEALGLAWADVNWDAGTVLIRQTVSRTRSVPGQRSRITVGEVKTPRSRRTIPLPALLVESLRSHRAAQARERLARGSRWQDHGLIFASSTGTPVDPRNFSRQFAKYCDNAGLGAWHVHELRHSAASLMLAQGVPLHVVSETLGHSSIRVTKDVYGHLEADAKREAVEATTALLFGSQ